MPARRHDGPPRAIDTPCAGREPEFEDSNEEVEMAIMMRMDWPDATAEQYDELRNVVNWEQDKADGGLFHVAAFDEAGAHITDVWESAEHFQRFTDERLMPGVQKVGIAGEPLVTVLHAHAVFAPGYE